MGRKMDINGTSGDDVIQAPHRSNVTVHGLEGNDTIFGGFKSNNELHGDEGDDLLSAGYSPGGNEMWGGAGADTFEFGSWATTPDQGGKRASIEDFESGDTISLLWVDPNNPADIQIVEQGSGWRILIDEGASWAAAIDVNGTEPTLADITFGTIFG